MIADEGCEGLLDRWLGTSSLYLNCEAIPSSHVMGLSRDSDRRIRDAGAVGIFRLIVPVIGATFFLKCVAMFDMQFIV